MKFKKIFGFSTVLVIILLCSIVSFAASVGNQLTSPESGWKRINSNDTLIKYTNFDNYNYVDALSYAGDLPYSTLSTAKVNFSFYGTKLRIIGTLNLPSSRPLNGLKITIDGISYYYNENATEVKKQAIEFEVNDLAQGFHNVTVSKKIQETGTFTFDAIDIDSSGYLVDSCQPQNLQAIADNAKVSLNWSKVDQATSYNIKRSTTKSGPYTKIDSSTESTYTDTTVTNGTTYYYVISSVNNSSESINSPEISAAPVKPKNNAILDISMANAQIKEFDLTFDEKDNFITWYTDRSNGTGSTFYVFTKKENVAPFLNSKEYISFNEISNFDVNEY